MISSDSRYRLLFIALVAIAAVSVLLLAGCSSSSQQVTPSSSGPANPASSSATPLVGGWSAVDQTDGAIPQDAQMAFEKAAEGYVGISFKPIALMGTQVVAGTNYMFLCVGNKVVQNPRTELYVVKVYQDLSGNAEFTSVESLNPLGQ